MVPPTAAGTELKLAFGACPKVTRDIINPVTKNTFLSIGSV
jgi:hypothetical protein